jgi:hypothetical protein
MSDKAWKATERAIAHRLGGERLPVNGRGDRPDVQHPVFAVEVKHRRTLPTWLKAAMAQARRGAGAGQLPVVVLHEAGSRHADDIVCVRLEDFAEWFGTLEVLT